MGKQNRITNAVEVLHGRYIKDDAKRKSSLETERVNADVARMIYDLRKKAGVTQKKLADLVGTTQSVISRLEDADYEGHSLSMLRRVADALGATIRLEIEPKRPPKKSAVAESKGTYKKKKRT